MPYWWSQFRQGLNASLNLLKRTVGQPFAAGGGLVDTSCQPRHILSCLGLSLFNIFDLGFPF